VDDKLDAFLDGLSRYASFLPADDGHPLEILILRGHLLIEEELRQLVALKFIKPTAYNLSEKKFGALLSLGEALYGPEIPEWVWRVARTLNGVRNSMAHELEARDVKAGVDGILKVFEARDSTYAYAEGNVLGKLNYCLSAMHVELLRARTK
jgi:hypothetical protein